MTSLLLTTSWMVPLLLAPFSSWRPVKWIIPLALVPALTSLLILQDGQTVKLEWLLLGTHLGLDNTARWFLSGSLLIWVSVAIYNIKWLQNSIHSAHFYVFFLLSMSGNILLILAMDMVTFYLGFALMGISAFGLIANASTTQARKAGYIYLAWTISGEVILFCAVILLAGQTNSTMFTDLKTTSLSDVALILVLIGFAIKIAIPGLHVWLPLTYSALPSASAAVFSGPMISAGLLGLIRFLANADYAYEMVGQILIIFGFFGALYGVTIGLLQSCPKVVLGYSSISKMGFLAATLGLALIYPTHSSGLIAAITVYAVHHLLVKSALFLGIGFLQQGIARAWVITAILMLCMALAGLPLTSGAAAKAEISMSIPIDAEWFYLWLSIIAAASILLVGRIFYLLLSLAPKATPANRSGLTAWFGVVLSVSFFPLLLAPQQEGISNVLPMLGAIIIILMVLILKPAPLMRLIGLIPPGDIIYPITTAFNWIQHYLFIPITLILKNQIEVFRQQWQRLFSTYPHLNFQPMPPSWIGILWIVIATLILLFIITGTSPNT